MPKDIRFGVRELLVCEVIDSFNEQAPSEFLCPISLQSMRRPVKCSDGFVYEHVVIQKWCDAHDGEGLPSSPMTRAPLQPKHVAYTKLMHRMRSWVRTKLALENADKDAFVTSMRDFLGKSADDVMDVDEYTVEEKQVDDHFGKKLNSSDLLRVADFDGLPWQLRRWNSSNLWGFAGVTRSALMGSRRLRSLPSRVTESDFFNL